MYNSSSPDPKSSSFDYILSLSDDIIFSTKLEQIAFSSFCLAAFVMFIEFFLDQTNTDTQKHIDEKVKMTICQKLTDHKTRHNRMRAVSNTCQQTLKTKIQTDT